MSCVKCTEVPHVPQGVNGVYISASHEYIPEKINTILTRESFKTTKHGIISILSPTVFLML